MKPSHRRHYIDSSDVWAPPESGEEHRMLDHDSFLPSSATRLAAHCFGPHRAETLAVATMVKQWLLRTGVPRALLDIRLLAKMGSGQLLIVSDGMPRSGSTLLYNITRLCLESTFDDLSAGWIADVRPARGADAYLFKTHYTSPPMRRRASTILYSFRDVRDALVSAHLKFDGPLSLDACAELVARDRKARRYATSTFRYEDMVASVPATIERVADTLGMTVDAPSIARALPSTTPRDACRSYDPLTSMHGGHASGMAPGDWRQHLSSQLQDEIAGRFEDWFHEAGYPTQ